MSENKALRVSEELARLLLNLAVVSANLTKKLKHSIREKQAMGENADNGPNRRIAAGGVGSAYSHH